MIPLLFVKLESFPLTPNGKLDRKVLPLPEYDTNNIGYLAPRTELEEQLVTIWKRNFTS